MRTSKQVKAIAKRLDFLSLSGPLDHVEAVVFTLDALRRRAKRLRPAKQQPIIEFLNSVENK